MEKELTQKLEAVEEELRRSVGKVAQLRERDKELSARDTTLSRRIQQSEEELRVAQERVRGLERDLDAATGRVDDLVGKLKHSEAERTQAAADATEEIHNLKTQKASSRLTSLQEDGKRLEKVLAEAREEGRRKEELAQALAGQVKELEGSVREREAQAAQLAAESNQNARARAWHADALSDRLKLAEEQLDKAAAREEELLNALEVSQTTAAQISAARCSRMSSTNSSPPPPACAVTTCVNPKEGA